MSRVAAVLSSRSRWGIVAAVAAAVAGASLVPESVLRAAAGALPVGGAGAGMGTGTFPVWLRPDVVAHVVGYAAVAAAVARALDEAERSSGRPERTPVRALGVAFAAAVGTGAAVELLQPLVGRGFSWIDLAGNAVGAAVGCALWWRWSHRRHRDAGR